MCYAHEVALANALRQAISNDGHKFNWSESNNELFKWLLLDCFQRLGESAPRRSWLQRLRHAFPQFMVSEPIKRVYNPQCSYLLTNYIGTSAMAQWCLLDATNGFRSWWKVLTVCALCGTTGRKVLASSHSRAIVWVTMRVCACMARKVRSIDALMHHKEIPCRSVRNCLSLRKHLALGIVLKYVWCQPNV